MTTARLTIRHVDEALAARQERTPRVDFTDSHVPVSPDGKPYVDEHDTYISGSGSVAVWTKADRVTAFDFALGGQSRYSRSKRTMPRRPQVQALHSTPWWAGFKIVSASCLAPATVVAAGAAGPEG
jgi:hypothetical protein